MQSPSAALPLLSGSTGEEVRDLQRRLARAGFEPVGASPGVLDGPTEEALGRFQAAHGLRPDRSCGTQTWSALVEAGYRLGDRLLYERRPMLRGDDVAELQTRLGRLGFFDDAVDGILGPRTSTATRDFQRNTALTADGICGPETVAALHRLGERKVAVVKGGLLERERLRSGPRRLDGRRVLVGELGGLDALAAAVAHSLAEQGAVVATSHHPDQSSQAGEANQFEADLYLGLTLHTGPGATVAYYGRPDYESVGGRGLAHLLAERLDAVLVGDAGASAMRIPALRETRMVAVWCEIGTPSDVVQRLATIAGAISDAVQSWVAAPVEG